MMQEIETRIKSLISANLFLEAGMLRNILAAIHQGMKLEDIDKAMDVHLSLKGTGGNEQARFVKNLIRDNVQH